MLFNRTLLAVLLAGAAAIAFYGASRLADTGQPSAFEEAGDTPEAAMSADGGDPSEGVESGEGVDAADAPENEGTDSSAAAVSARAPGGNAAAGSAQRPGAAEDAEASIVAVEEERPAATASREGTGATLVARDAGLARLEAALAERDETLTNLRARLEGLEREMEAQRADIAALEAELDRTGPSPLEVSKFLGTDENPLLTALRSPARFPLASAEPTGPRTRPLPAPRETGPAAYPEGPAPPPNGQAAGSVPRNEPVGSGPDAAEPFAPSTEPLPDAALAEEPGADGQAQPEAEADPETRPDPILLARIEFGSASAELTPGARARAAELADEIAALEGPAAIRVTGHSDRTGPPAVNERLSLERAEAVAAALVEGGVPPERIETAGLGAAPDRLPVPTPAGTPEPRNRAASVWIEPDK